MDEDAQSEDRGKNESGDPGLMAPEDPGVVAAQPGTSLHEALPLAIPALTAPSGMPPMLGTSAIDAAICRQRVTDANNVQFLSSTQCFLQNPGTQNTESRDQHHTCTGKTMVGRTMDGPS
jgi:hypothetical protein